VNEKQATDTDSVSSPSVTTTGIINEGSMEIQITASNSIFKIAFTHSLEEKNSSKHGMKISLKVSQIKIRQYALNS
ncbi:unnamed protein product, partial [Allacma fusca]